jgi:hypothetical protein
LVTVPVNDFSLCNICFSISTGALRDDGPEFIVLLRSGEKFTDQNDLLEAFLLADLKADLLGVTKLVGREVARTRVVGAFPDKQSALNPAAARLRHIAGTAWSTKRYLNIELLKDQQMRGAIRVSQCRVPLSPKQMCEKTLDTSVDRTDRRGA